MITTSIAYLLLLVAGGPAEDDPLLAEFKRFDRDGSGYLSRAEMAQCGCAALDKNGDLILMPAEFLAGRATPSPNPPVSTAPKTGASKPAAAETGSGASSLRSSKSRVSSSAPWRAGDRVKAGCYGNMKEGIVDRIEGDRAFVKFADEPNCDAWREVAALKPAGAASQPGTGARPVDGGAPPSGTYVCQKLSGSSLIGLGNLVISGSRYSGIGGGPTASFSVGGDGGLVWSRGLQGMPEGWSVTSSRYAGLDSQGRPMIKIAYRTSRGSSDLIDCIRE